LLSHIYGGKYSVASRHPRHEHASLKIIRWGLQQLEKQKIIKKDKKGDALKINSRVISEEGRGTLNRIATEFVNAKNKKWMICLFDLILLFPYFILFYRYVHLFIVTYCYF